MAFYLTPPSGNISLQKLTQFTIKRFNFLCKVYNTSGDKIQIFDIVNNPDTVYDSECLIEGSVKDKVSHFMLRLICSGNDDMTSFFIKAETFLFDYRFSCMTEDELCRLFKSADRAQLTMSEYLDMGGNSVHSYIKTFLHILSLIKGDNSRWRKVIRKYLQGEKSYFLLPFQTVLQYVATRQVIVKSGEAQVPVYKLREVITSQFTELLSGCMKNLRTKFHSEDERIIGLVQTLKVIYKQHYPTKRVTDEISLIISHCEVDRLTEMFPPCMTHLHHKLRSHHRLRHHARIQYSLFLKEAGLPVHEALMFWRKEYSQLPSNESCCSHDWLKNEKRYVYNIRHLYGLEGSRINYRGHSCEALQTCHTGPQDDGGCPFKHFDLVHLDKLLNQHGVSHKRQIMQAVQSRQYSLACSYFLQEKIQQNSTSHYPDKYWINNKDPDNIPENTRNISHDLCKENVQKFQRNLTGGNLTVHSSECKQTTCSKSCEQLVKSYGCVPAVRSGNCRSTEQSKSCEQTLQSDSSQQSVFSSHCERMAYFSSSEHIVRSNCEQSVHSSSYEQDVHSSSCRHTTCFRHCEQMVQSDSSEHPTKPLSDKTNSSEESYCQDSSITCSKQMISTKNENDHYNFTSENCECILNNERDIGVNYNAEKNEQDVDLNSTVLRHSDFCKLNKYLKSKDKDLTSRTGHMLQGTCMNHCQDTSVTDINGVHLFNFRSPIEYVRTYKQLMK